MQKRGIQSDDVFGRQADPDNFLALANALQKQFNGDVFPLPADSNEEWQNNGAISFLARIFAGDVATLSNGSLEIQLALDFQAYDFSFIPVELLSSIYEQFLNDEERGDGDGVVYTPEPLADYVLAELQAVKPLQLTYRVLDPCCGSGIFLVLAYRRLIELAWQQHNRRPTPEELRQILTQSIFGVEKDREACYITAFSLLLTLLSHIDPPELQTDDGFQFPTLVGINIFESDFFNRPLA
jgi:type I restriction-modification system DNA methylase subunit